MPTLNDTHNPQHRSWVESANSGNSDFPIQNLPFACLRRAGSDETFRGAVAIGDQVLDLSALSGSGLLTGLAQSGAEAASASSLNDFMGMGLETWSALRAALSVLLREGSDQQSSLEGMLIAQGEVEYTMPCTVGDYTDFYSSVHHATSVGALFRPDNPLLPNYKWVPIGYHGRASSIGISGQTFPRPMGQLKGPDDAEPRLGLSQRLDYELEMGIFVGKGNELGSAISIDDAEDHVFGLCLFNDWSARDIQAWEYQPLGPFLAKNFASTISPWIVTVEALAPYRENFSHPSDDPQPLPYLSSETNSDAGSFDVKLECLLLTEKMFNDQQAPTSLSQSSFKHSYWTVAQMVTHHTVNGCNLRSGDLLGTGTQSGPSHEEAGSMLELSRGGKESITLPNGETRKFLADGDTVIMRGFCQRPGAARIGFGEAVGTVLPAKV
jgi:fumarylacetoacetase